MPSDSLPPLPLAVGKSNILLAVCLGQACDLRHDCKSWLAFTATHPQNRGLILVVRPHTPLVCALPQAGAGRAPLTARSRGLPLLGRSCTALCPWAAGPGSIQCQPQALELGCIQMLPLRSRNHGGVLRAQVCYLFWGQCLGGTKDRKIGLGCQL